MPDMDAQEIFSPDDNVRPRNRYMTELTDADGDYCVIHCTLPPGVIVPLHSHGDRETFYVLSGTPDSFRNGHWKTLKPGEAVDVLGDAPHAWRNASGGTVSMLC